MEAHTFLGLSSEGFHRIFYREYGNLNARTLIAVHGLTRNSSDFHFLGESLKNEYNLFAPDIAGRGKSDWFINPWNYNFPQYLADMTALIARTGVEELVWLGTSMGGILGMILASLPCECPPIQALILNDIGPVIPKQAIDRIKKYAGIKLVFQDLKEASMRLREIYKPYGFTNEEEWEYLIQNSVEQQEDGTYTLAYDSRALSTLGEEIPGQQQQQMQKDQEGNLIFWNYWDLIKCPVLVIQGEQSDILTDDIINEMKTRGPQFDHIVIENTGHAPALFAESRIKLIQDWLGKFN